MTASLAGCLLWFACPRTCNGAAHANVPFRPDPDDFDVTVKRPRRPHSSPS